MSKVKYLKQQYGVDWLLVRVNKRPTWMSSSGILAAIVDSVFMAIGQRI